MPYKARLYGDILKLNSGEKEEEEKAKEKEGCEQRCKGSELSTESPPVKPLSRWSISRRGDS